jgi:hypothetical protein
MEELNVLKLPWLTLLPNTIKEKWGGWVSKNYVSLLRVALWVFSQIMTIDDADKYIEPEGDPKKWTVKEYQGWLWVRVSDSKGTSTDGSNNLPDNSTSGNKKYIGGADTLEMSIGQPSFFITKESPSQQGRRCAPSKRRKEQQRRSTANEYQDTCI